MQYLFESTQYILGGCTVTLKLFFITLLVSMPLGFLCAMGKLRVGGRCGRDGVLHFGCTRDATAAADLFVYYGLPILFPELRMERFNAAAFTFVLNYGAYFTEIFRGGIQSIDRGQYEASQVLGMSYLQTMRRIVLPQTLKRVLPPVSNEAITLVKDTALVVVLGIGDILRNSKEIVARDFTISPFVIAALIYLLMNYLVVLFFKRLEKRHSVYE